MDYVHLLSRALKGQLSLRFVVITTIVLFWIAAVLIIYMLLLRGYYHLRLAYMRKRRKLYEPGIQLALMEEPRDKVIEALRPRRWGDEDSIQEALLDAMSHLTGGPFALLQAAAARHGFIERNLKQLRSGNKFNRGNAMEALGIMRAQPAIAEMVGLMPALTQDLKLTALRSLALIGDPSALPCYRAAADTLPPAMLPRLASLMLEYGQPAALHIQDLVRDHPDAFPPRIMKILLAETAAAQGRE